MSSTGTLCILINLQQHPHTVSKTYLGLAGEILGSARHAPAMCVQPSRTLLDPQRGKLHAGFWCNTAPNPMLPQLAPIACLAPSNPRVAGRPARQKPFKLPYSPGQCMLLNCSTLPTDCSSVGTADCRQDGISQVQSAWPRQLVWPETACSSWAPSTPGQPVQYRPKAKTFTQHAGQTPPAAASCWVLQAHVWPGSAAQLQGSDTPTTCTSCRMCMGCSSWLPSAAGYYLARHRLKALTLPLLAQIGNTYRKQQVDA